ncbi:MAG: hypothetical protein DRJ01_12960 [Bacteroidetes bacterium]|nr:MAG: hypothetical protein DRJ01_12960 [Bacteroidota bacterium]
MIKNIHKLYILIILISISNIGTCQNKSARLQIITGGNVDFIFNSFKKYDSGIVYTDYTKLKIYYIDTDGAGVHQNTNWQLDFKANSANIEGTSNNLDLRTIELTANNGAGTTANCLGKKQLSSLDVTLVDTGKEISFEQSLINITYDCGTNATYKVLNKNPDFYFVDIIFTASPQ